MLEYRFENIEVNCPGRPFRVEKMQMRFVKMEKGWLPCPCNGCDSANGTLPCEWCSTALTLMFFHDPEMDVSKPITPEMPEKAQ